jgi:hypothetical protein
MNKVSTVPSIIAYVSYKHLTEKKNVLFWANSKCFVWYAGNKSIPDLFPCSGKSQKQQIYYMNPKFGAMGLNCVCNFSSWYIYQISGKWF